MIKKTPWTYFRPRASELQGGHSGTFNRLTCGLTDVADFTDQMAHVLRP